ncbi:LamG-like jellyroll fold domain-containing protein [Micromonospora sp. M12]
MTWASDVRLAGGQTATFNGTSSYGQASGQVVDTSKSYSVAAWVRLTDKSADRTLVAKDASGWASLYFQYLKSADRWVAQMPSATSGTTTWWVARSTSVPQTNVWTHLTTVYDAVQDTLNLYVNGSLESTVTGVVGFNDATGPSISAGAGRGQRGGRAASPTCRSLTGSWCRTTSPASWPRTRSREDSTSPGS